MKNRLPLIIAIIFVAIAVSAIYWFLLKPSDVPQLVDCSFSSSDNVEVNGDFWVRMFVGDMGSNYSYVDENQNLTLRTFSLTDLANYKTNLKQDIFFLVRNSRGDSLGRTIEIDMQICNASNKTTPIDFASNSSTVVRGLNIYGHNTTLPSEPGTYRIDGIIKVDDQMFLVGRISDVVFTK